jgi:hypothetical protein
MSLFEAEALELLSAHSHGVLGTLHEGRGVDMTPIVYATDGRFLGSPVDRVKLKSSLRLQRQRNLESDARATLLVEHWDPVDWSKLWWVRAELRWVGHDTDSRSEALADRLAATYEQYRDSPFETVLVFEIVKASGWSAGGGGQRARGGAR